MNMGGLFGLEWDLSYEGRLVAGGRVLTYKSHATVLSPILCSLTPMYRVTLISLLLSASISQQVIGPRDASFCLGLSKHFN